MSLNGMMFMDDPAVDAALHVLADAVERAATAAGLTFKAVAVVGHTLEARGIAMSGCACNGCRRAMLASLGRALHAADASDDGAAVH